jgi:hypothetical protein
LLLGEEAAYAPWVFLGVFLLCCQDPLFCTCWEGQLTCWRPLLLPIAKEEEVKVANFLREELFSSVLDGVFSLSITLFYKFPCSQFPQTTKLQFAG